MKTIVIGLGNPILGDDGVGWRVVEAVQEQVTDPTIEFDCAAVGGLTLMEYLIDYDRAIIIDAVTAHQPVGTVSCFCLNDLPQHPTLHTSSPHDTSLQTALAAGQAMGAHLPDDVMVVGIEAERIFDFSEDLSPDVEKAVPHAADEVLMLLEKETHYDLT
jgi:hydrogenase maturation protease